MLGFYNYTVILTFLGLISGVGGIIQASFYGNTTYALMFLMFSGMCDMFDGKIARTKKDRTVEQKDFGIQLDSLCDLVCFGVLPICIGLSIGIDNIIGYIVMTLYVMGAVIRLAYFNVMEKKRQEQTNEVRKYYQGLPVTTVAGFFPILFLFEDMCGKYMYIYFEVVMFVIAILFVLKIKIKKPGMKGMLALVVLGIFVISQYVIKGLL